MTRTVRHFNRHPLNDKQICFINDLFLFCRSFQEGEAAIVPTKVDAYQRGGVGIVPTRELKEKLVFSRLQLFQFFIEQSLLKPNMIASISTILKFILVFSLFSLNLIFH